MAKKKTSPDATVPTPDAEPVAAVADVPARPRRAPVVETPAPKPPEEFDAFDPSALTADPADATPEPEAEPEAAPAPVAEAPKVKVHPKVVVREALDWGILQSEIDATDTDDLRLAIYERQRAFRLQQERAKATPPEPKPEPEAEPALPFDEKDYEGWGDGVKETLSKRDQVIKDLIKAQKERDRELAEIKAHLQEQRSKSIQQRLTALRKEHAAVFAADPAGTAKWQAALSLLQVRGNELKRQNEDHLEEDFAEVVSLLGFAPAAASPPPPPPKPTAPEPTPEEQELAKRKAEWKAGQLAKPTARTAIELPPGEKKALRTLKEKLAPYTAGQLPPDEEESELDDFFGPQK
jgi:hypothetical protein